MEKITTFIPAFDKRAPEPSENYGVGALRCVMILKGDEGAVTFTFSTGIYLPETMQEYAASGRLNPKKYSCDPQKWHMLNEPMAFDISYHARIPHYDGQSLSQKHCDFIGGPCYCDGSLLEADKYLDALIREGSDKVWEMMESYYKETFAK